MFTKRLAVYAGLSYPERLEKAGLNTLELRRLHADLCLCYNILHGNLDTEISHFFKLTLPAKPEDTPGKLKSLYHGRTRESIIFHIEL